MGCPGCQQPTHMYCTCTAAALTGCPPPAVQHRTACTPRPPRPSATARPASSSNHTHHLLLHTPACPPAHAAAACMFHLQSFIKSLSPSSSHMHASRVQHHPHGCRAPSPLPNKSSSLHADAHPASAAHMVDRPSQDTRLHCTIWPQHSAQGGCRLTHLQQPLSFRSSSSSPPPP